MIIALTAPHLFARFQNTPSTSGAKKPAAASENAADTRNRMSAGAWIAVQAARPATISSRILEIRIRFCVEALGLIIL